MNYDRNLASMIGRVNSTTGNVGGDAARSWTYGYDLLERLITADNDNGTGEDRSYRCDDADNKLFSSSLCTGTSDNLVYQPQGPASVRPHAPTSICGMAVN